jgi:hypothetical protein
LEISRGRRGEEGKEGCYAIHPFFYLFSQNSCVRRPQLKGMLV